MQMEGVKQKRKREKKEKELIEWEKQIMDNGTFIEKAKVMKNRISR